MLVDKDSHQRNHYMVTHLSGLNLPEKEEREGGEKSVCEVHLRGQGTQDFSHARQETAVECHGACCDISGYPYVDKTRAIVQWPRGGGGTQLFFLVDVCHAGFKI